MSETATDTVQTQAKLPRPMGIDPLLLAIVGDIPDTGVCARTRASSSP